MGVLTELDYTVKPPNAVQRGMQIVASTRPAAWLFSKTMHPVDRVLYRWSKGRLTVPGIVAGLPVVFLSTTGAKSGEQRTMPLLGIPIGDDLAVIGSNYGQEKTPGWVFNLEADPHGDVRYRDATASITARAATDEETDEAFMLASRVYPGYAKYRERADHRVIRVFLLHTEPGER